MQACVRDAPDQQRRLRVEVDRLASEAEEHVERADRDAIAAVRAYLAGPLTVAVIGRVAVGKSTLVNALLGATVAATNATECTQVVTTFTHGLFPAAHVRLVDGRTERVMLPASGRLPDTLGMPLDQVHDLAVTHPSHVLRQLRLVDTPGLASAATANSERTAALIAASSARDAAAADALMFVLNGPLRGDEAAAVETFVRAAGHRGGHGVVAVLTKADTLSGDDVLAAARELASSIAADNRQLFAAVVPAVGLLAETSACGRLTEAHARALAELAAAWTTEDAALACSDGDVFVSAPGPVEPSVRADLLGRLGLFGVVHCLGAIRQGSSGAQALTELAGQLSGLSAVNDALGMQVAGRVDALKARRGIEMLSEVARGMAVGQGSGADRSLLEPGRACLAEAIEDLLLSPSMTPLVLLEAYASVASGRVGLPPRLASDLRELVLADLESEASDPGRARQQIGRWREFMLLASGKQRAVADAAVRAWEQRSSAAGEITIAEAAREAALQ